MMLSMFTDGRWRVILSAMRKIRALVLPLPRSEYYDITVDDNAKVLRLLGTTDNTHALCMTATARSKRDRLRPALTLPTEPCCKEKQVLVYVSRQLFLFLDSFVAFKQDDIAQCNVLRVSVISPMH